jgi:hypothetical protein
VEAHGKAFPVFRNTLFVLYMVKKEKEIPVVKPT